MAPTLAEDDLVRDSIERTSREATRGNERLYEAYNELHCITQAFDKPFDAPAILVVGHQTDGKSALLEALMGFQFNSVGGGTKTRRPIALHMKYNSACHVPTCFLLSEDGSSEHELLLSELQAYIDADNAALEQQQTFSGREIVVRMEYKHCPNLTIIDTPGLISAAPGKKHCALQACAHQVETIIRSKAQVQEHIILCLEDCSDWSNATTRRLVMQVDPNLTRTVLVSTKLDTKIPQFARGSDCETFLHPSGMDSSLGDGPFFTSVPSGRVGQGSDCVFASHEAFRERLAEREAQDVSDLEAKMGRRLTRDERCHVGVSSLRKFLEQLLQRRYLDAVPAIVPLLEREQRATQQRASAIKRDVEGLSPEQLKEKGRDFCEAFLTKLQQLLRGTIAASPDKWGESLMDEHLHGGAFLGPGSKPLSVLDSLANAHMRLYGGAQFHRAMSEFRLAVGALPCPEISREELVNACGIDMDTHDGVNYVRTACVIAVSKAQQLFEPFIHQLGSRLAHVLRRLLPISMDLMANSAKAGGSGGGLDATGSRVASVTQELLLRRVSGSFHNFLEEVERSCKAKCLEDLMTTTRYVSWSLHSRNRSLRSMIGKVKPQDTSPSQSSSGRSNTPPSTQSLQPSGSGKAAFGGADACGSSPAMAVLEVLEGTLWNRQLTGTTEDIVGGLVCQMFEGIRDHMVQAAELKFNCFFLMPLIDLFPARLRRELETAYEQDLDNVFDAGSMRIALEEQQRQLEAEIRQVDKLQRKFQHIHATLLQGGGVGGMGQSIHGPPSSAHSGGAPPPKAGHGQALKSAAAASAGGPGPTSRAITITDLDASVALPEGISSVLQAPPLPFVRQANSGPAPAAPSAARPGAEVTPVRKLPVPLNAPAVPVRTPPSSAAGAGAPLERDRAERDAKDKPLSSLMGHSQAATDKPLMAQPADRVAVPAAK